MLAWAEHIKRWWTNTLALSIELQRWSDYGVEEKENIVLKWEIWGCWLCMYRCWMWETAVVMVGWSEVWVGWSLLWAQQPNSSARWTPPGGLSGWPLVTMETLVGPGLYWGQLQDCKPGWSDLLKNGQKGNSVYPLSAESHTVCIASLDATWMNSPEEKLQQSRKRWKV